MVHALILVAIVIAITLGYKTRINTGFFGMAFAYLIGSFVLGMKPSEVILTWPVSIFFVILSICLFYNFAIINGTLEKLSQHLLYCTRKFPKYLPIAIFFCAMIISGLGSGFFAVMAFFAPITIILCRKTGLSPLIGALAVNSGAICGNCFMISPGGVVFIELMSNFGYQSKAYLNEIHIFLATLIVPLVLLMIMILFSKHGDILEDLEIKKPKPFNKQQKTNLALIFLMVFTVLLFPILDDFFPTISLSGFNKSIDVGLVAILFTILGLLLKVGDQKDIIKQAPLETIIMICGVGMLIAVAIKAGTIQMISDFVSTSIPVFLVPIVMCVISGLMALFCSPMGVVAPALFPLVNGLVDATGINATVLFLAIIIGAQASVISPFSSGGSLILSVVNDSERETMFNDLLFKGAPFYLFFSVIYVVVLTMFM